MRYMIAHMVSGDARKYHENLSRAIAATYKLRPSTATIDPHLTVKAPFEALDTDISELEHFTERFAHLTSPAPYTLTGFGNFEDRVIYMHVDAPEETVSCITDFKNELKGIPWLEFKPHEREVVLHATLAYPRDKEQALEILERLTLRQSPAYTCMLDTVALLKKGDRRWEVVKEYQLKGNGAREQLPQDVDLISGAVLV